VRSVAKAMSFWRSGESFFEMALEREQDTGGKATKIWIQKNCLANIIFFEFENFNSNIRILSYTMSGKKR
jgi:hypothetical protein